VDDPSPPATTTDIKEVNIVIRTKYNTMIVSANSANAA